MVRYTSVRLLHANPPPAIFSAYVLYTNSPRLSKSFYYYTFRIVRRAAGRILFNYVFWKVLPCETGGNMRDFDIAGLEALAGREARSTPPDGFFPRRAHGEGAARGARRALRGPGRGRGGGMARRQPLSHRARGPRRGAGLSPARGGCAPGGRARSYARRPPRWSPPSPAAVDERAAGAYFAAYARETPPHPRGARPHRRGDQVRAGRSLSRGNSTARRARRPSPPQSRACARSPAPTSRSSSRASDLCGQILARDPAGVYASMDDEGSRALYRRRLAHLAKREGISESACARRVLELAEAHAGDPRRSHVGWWPARGAPREACAASALGALCALAVFITAALVSAAAGARIGRASHGPARAAARARNCEKTASTPSCCA